MVHKALKAAEELKAEDINARVINISTIKPIDEEIIIKAAKETKGIVTVEEHSVIGGLGDRVSSVVCSNYPVLVKKIGVNDVFGESGNPDLLLEKHGLTVENTSLTPIFLTNTGNYYKLQMKLYLQVHQ